MRNLWQTKIKGKYLICEALLSPTTPSDIFKTLDGLFCRKLIGVEAVRRRNMEMLLPK